ncbi:ABC transporter ATP-binding protein [Nocardia jejuensis]|uniref:ABC transporter ATP-binding protein n=1 Tax=Nocardia jejuensis TaxID=328049 RepID=UPI0009FF5A2F|nr:ABC transporter ATP-binding protein [Nocardia jejuensis]
MSLMRGGAQLSSAVEPDGRTLRDGLMIMLRGCREHPGAAALALGASLINGGCMVLGAKAVGWSIDHVVVAAFREGRFLPGAAVLGALAVLGVSFLRVVTIIVRGVASGIIQFRSEARTRRAVVSHYLRLGISWHRRSSAGELVSRAVSDVQSAWDPMKHFPFAFGMAGMLLLVLLDVALADPWLAVVAMILIPLLLGANLAYQRVLAPRAREAQTRRAEVTTLAHEAIAGQQVIRTLGIADREIERFAAAAAGARAANRRMGSAGAVFDPAIELMPPVAALVILAIGVTRVEAGHLGVGTLVGVIYLLITTAMPLNALGRFLGVLPTGVAGHARVDQVLSATERPRHGDRELSGSGPVPLEMHGVAFGYTAATAVRDLSLRVPAGSIVAVVGPTGAGKSTVLGLLSYLLEPGAGAVRLGDVDATALAPEAVRRRTALVTQNAFLFTDTIRANIALGERECDELVWRALGIADAAAFVAALPEGLDTLITDTVQLSGGQRQRIALARAVFRRPGLLLLDDATSALDPLVERSVIDALRGEYGGGERRTTVVLVGHRAATIGLADTVVFLGSGRILAQGTHCELLATEPGYRALLGAYDTTEAVA